MREGELGHEQNRERFPTFEEVFLCMKEAIGGEQYREDRKLEDEKGLYLLELVIDKEDGTKVEYAFRRKGKSPAGDSVSSSISVAYYDADGMPFKGQGVADFIEGKWVKITSP